jgi:hypothetical protein
MYRRMSRRLMRNPATRVAIAKPPTSFHLFISPPLFACSMPVANVLRRTGTTMYERII